MIHVWVDGNGLRALRNMTNQLRAAKAQIADRRIPMQKVKERQIRRWEQNFDGKGNIYEAWPGLSGTWTVPERVASGFGSGPMLVRTGTLKISFIDQNQAGRVNDTSIFWAFRNQAPAYPLSHHEGYPNPISGRADIPARKLWDLNGEDEEAAVKINERAIDSIIARYF